MSPFYLRLLITSHFIALASGTNLILLLQRTGLYQYNLTCVASEESSKYALLWTVYDSENFNVMENGSDNYIDKFDSGYFISNYFKKGISKPIPYNLPGVIDRRWEDFKFISKYTLGQFLHHNAFDSYTGNASVINFSILLKQYMILQLKTDEGIYCVEIRKYISKEKFSTCEIITTFFLYSGGDSDYNEEWKHFSVYKQNGQYILRSSHSNEREEVEEFGFKALTVISESASIWKVHDYTFLRIDPVVSTELFAHFIRKPPTYDYMCISFYLFMESNNCQVAVTLCNRYCRQVYATKTFSNGGNWTEERIYLNNSDKQSRIHVFIKKSPNCTFAAVDNFRHCSLNKNRILNMQTDNYEVGCLSLSKENSIVHYKRPDFKKNQTESTEFSNFLQEGKQVICNQENCYCPSGFKGDWCDEEPTVTLRIEDVAATSANLYFEIESHYPTLQIDLNGVLINNITVEGTHRRYQLLNLCPATTYTCMAKFCSTSSCTRYIYNNLTTNACNVLTTGNILVMNSLSSFTLNLINFNNYTCPPNFFEVINGTDYKILQNHTVFSNLIPFDYYVVTVRLIPRYRRHTLLPVYQEEYSFDLYAQTMYSGNYSILQNISIKVVCIFGFCESDILLTISFNHEVIFNSIPNLTVPDKVQNIRTTSISSTEVIINFDPPIGMHFINKYSIAYKRIGSACGDLYLEKTLYETTSNNNSFKLSGLQPYSTYNISIWAMNNKGNGPMETYVFKTLDIGYISDEEMFIDLLESSWKFLACEIMKGPLEYKVIANCMEVWCSGTLNETYFEIYDTSKATKFIDDLLSYSQYNITVMISRNGTGYKYLKDFTIFTPSGKPHPVTDLRVYTRNENSLALRFKPPYPPTGLPEYKIAVCYFEICQHTVNVRNCSLWDGYLCADVENLKEHREYSVTVWASNQNISDKSMSTTQVQMEQTAPEAPRILGKTRWPNCTIQLEWGHPDATNGPLKYFQVTLKEIQKNSITTIKVSVNEELKTYTAELRDLQNSSVYEAYIQAFNVVEGERSDIVKLETCSGSTQLTWIVISIIIPLVILITLAVVFLIIKCSKNYKKEENIHLYNPLELEHLISHSETMVFPKREFPAEIEKYLNFDRFNEILYNEYVDLPVTASNLNDIISVQGMNGCDTYISSKSPTSSKINAFWNCVWEQNINVIICHQTLEESRDSGKKYWPEDDGTFSTDTINVTCDSFESFSDFYVRNLRLAKVGQIDRLVKHVNFISYPPDDIPTFPFSYVVFLSYIKSLVYANQKIMVHCSDGANRTGVFIMCYDFLHTQTDIVNIPEILNEMRKSNPQFINKIIHYKFVYFVFHEILCGQLTGVPENTFMRQYDVLYQQKLEEEFNYIQKTKFVYSLLRFPVPEEPYKTETARVIGFQGKTTYWTTRYLGMNKKIIWKFVIERNIKVIVMLQNMEEIRRNIWPANTNDQISCRGIKVNMDTCLNKRCYKLKLTANGDTSDILLLYFEDWSCRNDVPPDCRSFYALYNFYTTIKTGTDVLLCCDNGFTACGVFIGFDLVLQKLRFENVFDLCWAVRSMNFKNDVFLDIIEQHQFIYSAILYYLEEIQGESEDSGTIYEPLNFRNESTYTPSYDFVK